MRPKVLSTKELVRLPVLTDDEGIPLPTDHPRPKLRSECRGGVRPCPYVGCHYHLYLDVDPESGAIKFNFPDIPPDELERLPETCALDVAERGALTLDEISLLMNFQARERSRQIVESVLVRLRPLLGYLNE